MLFSDLGGELSYKSSNFGARDEIIVPVQFKLQNSEVVDGLSWAGSETRILRAEQNCRYIESLDPTELAVPARRMMSR
jgi:hypothetical protein